MSWREDTPVSPDVMVLQVLMANLGVFILSGGPLWITLIPVGLVGAMLLPMSVLNVMAKRSARALVMSIFCVLIGVGPAVALAMMSNHSG